MTRNSQIFAVLGAITLCAAAPALADSQLISSAGLTPEQAQGMSLTEIAQYKFNRDVSNGDRWNPSVVAGNGPSDHTQLAAAAGVSPNDARGASLTELAASKFNRESRPDDYQSVTHSSSMTVATRSTGETTRAFVQLIASAGLTPAQAKGMSLSEIAQYKFDRDVSGADRQTVALK